VDQLLVSEKKRIGAWPLTHAKRSAHRPVGVNPSSPTAAAAPISHQDRADDFHVGSPSCMVKFECRVLVLVPRKPCTARYGGYIPPVNGQLTSEEEEGATVQAAPNRPFDMERAPRLLTRAAGERCDFWISHTVLNARYTHALEYVRVAISLTFLAKCICRRQR
jgi:hypothetical protein